jgi:hypothetical protein
MLNQDTMKNRSKPDLSETLYLRYPRLKNLRKLVPDDLIEREVGSRAEEFERYLAVARGRIPIVNLNQVFPEELERGAIRLESFLGNWGNVSVEELSKICLIVKWLQPERILELGTYNGLTTLQMALNAPSKCATYTLDLPPDLAASLPLSRLDELLARQFGKVFKTETGGYFKGRADLNIVQLWGDTANFDYSKIGTPVDLIFVDAAHDYENTRRDSDNAFRIVSPRGAILWHNYADVMYPDVTRSLSECAAARRLFQLRNTNLAVYYAPTGLRPQGAG